MITEAIILAGGRGTRLLSVVSDVPKPMAMVAGRPFLEYLLEQLISQQITRVVISVGYKAEIIIEHFGNTYKSLEIVYATENEPLGTGGGIKFALSFCQSDNIYVLNGDTYFGIQFQKISFFKDYYEAPFLIALREIENNGRFGGVEINDEFTITEFTPKEKVGNCLINAGIYLVNKSKYLSLNQNKAFSIEENIFPQLLGTELFKGIPCHGYFIDIGIPGDYYIANDKFKSFDIKPRYLLLDRDGVINQKIDHDYVRSVNNFVFIEGAVDAISELSKFFDYIFVVTNQRGVARGLVSEEALNSIHYYMSNKINESGGKLEKIYTCIHDYADKCDCRKPNIGLFQQIINDYPHVTPTQCIMVGDSHSDLEFGRKIGAKTVLIGNITNSSDVNLWDEIYPSLSHFKQSHVH